MAVTADSPLTVKQTRFAAAVASGKPKTVARRENYVENPAKPKATSRSASTLARQPHVAAEIRRLTWLSCPPVDDVRGMREHSVRVLSDLSRSAQSEEVRLKAALALYRIAETTLAAANPRATDTEQDKLLASLRKLYTEVKGKPAADDPLGAEPGPGVRYAYDDDPIDITAIATGAPDPSLATTAPSGTAPAREPEEPAPAPPGQEPAGSAPEPGPPAPAAACREPGRAPLAFELDGPGDDPGDDAPPPWSHPSPAEA